MYDDDRRYFERIEERLDEAWEHASRARERGFDPQTEIEIPIAEDMAARVENILGIEGVAERVRELEETHSREEAALALAEDFADGRVGDYDSRAGKIEGAVRTAVALLTEGVVAAPIEGIDRVEILTNDDGSEFVNVHYAGPIRSAGGTGQALSVLVADYARALTGLSEYHPREEEIERYAEEVALYDSDTGLQYSPKDKETKFIAKHMPVMLDGEATGDVEVSGYRDIERVDTNGARGGMCLVLAEGIALKASKIQRYTRDLDEIDWPWLQDLIDGTIGDDTAETDAADGADEDEAEADDGSDPEADAPADDPAGPSRADPSQKFLRDLIAGRPVFGHPSESGGFRLRYGRARNHGFATAGVHPATMHIVDDFLATGTQIKTERPGKAAGVVPVDSIEGPTVRLADGTVRRIDDPEEAEALQNGVERILDLGEYLVNYGEFVENNRPLAPAGYAYEWWIQDLEATDADVRALRDDARVDLREPTPDRALAWAREFDAPLHPTYTYPWHDVSVASFEALAGAVADAGRVVEAETDGGLMRRESSASDALALPYTEKTARTLERLLVEHRQGEDWIRVPAWRPLVASLGVVETDDGLGRSWADLPDDAREWDGGENAVAAVNAVAPFRVRERAPTRVGCRMGRPEKSESRDLSPAVHTLFPIGPAGGSQRDVTQAAGTTTGPAGEDLPLSLGDRLCPECGDHTYRTRCPDCERHTQPYYECDDCGQEVQPDEAGRVHCDRCDRDVTSPTEWTVTLADRYREALDRVGERETAFPILKGVKGLTSAHETPEPMEKGVLRAKHGVTAFKDGTVRYDMTDLPVTAVTPEELDVTADDLRELGYEEDVDGDPLRFDDQLVELKVQDVVLSDGAAEHMLKTADFVDDLLDSLYDLPPFYDVDERADLVGELVFGMAPHTSAAVVGRVVGFTSAAVGYAHPYFHAAKRRNCFHPDTKLWFQDEGGAWHHDRIERFVENRLDPETAREDDFGTLVSELGGDVFVPSVTEDGEQVIKPVEAVSKHPAPDHLVRVETRSGRELTVTPDHTMCRWSSGIERVDASELSAGDSVPVSPRTDTDEPPWTGEATFESGSISAPSTGLSGDGGGVAVELITGVEYVRSDTNQTYCLTVSDTHTLVTDGIAAAQCDGDEDCVMLLLDGLLNFSKEFLPNQRGGSVAADSRLLAVGPEGDVRCLTFAEFWDELDEVVHHDGKFEKKLVDETGWRTYAFDANHEAGLAPVERAIRYEASEDERLVRVQTQFGRSLDVTEHHSLFRYDDGIEEVAGGDLSPGDLVVAPQELGVESERTTVDVVDSLDDPYVFIDDHVEDLLRTVWETTAHGSDAHAAFDGGLSYRLSKRKISYDQLAEILSHAGLSVPDDTEVGLWGSETGIARRVDVDAEFAWLLGLFVAEGSLSGASPTLSNADEAVVDRAVEATNAALGHDPTVEWSNKAYRVRFPAVFRSVLGALGFDDPGASAKLVPDAILRAPRDVVLGFVRGFLAGDGSEPSDDNHTTIQFHTTSETVKDGFVFLLHRLGLVANVSRRERDDPRRPIYTVSVSGGASDNPLRRVLDGEEPYLPKGLVVSLPAALLELREMELEGVRELIPKDLKRRENVSLRKLEEIITELDDRDLPPEAMDRLAELRPLVDGDLSYLRVKSVERVDYDGYLYDLQVGGEPIFTANWLYAHNSMDAPLVMSSRIDPAEIDDEAHNMDIVREYPREFYEATLEMADPAEVDVRIAESTLGTDEQYRGFDHTHGTSDLHMGPALSAYKTLGSMMEKTEAQLELARRIRAVDESDVAERIIEYHFLPDLIGNLRAFSSQETRCLDCGHKYRRMPLTGDCRECGGRVNLTVHEGSVTKYLDTAIRVADQYDCREYTKQRLAILERSIERVFENDTNKQGSIADFM